MALKEEGVARGHFEVRGYRRNGKPIRGSCLRRSDGVDSHGENARRCEVAREISDRRPFVREEARVYLTGVPLSDMRNAVSSSAVSVGILRL